MVQCCGRNSCISHERETAVFTMLRRISLLLAAALLSLPIAVQSLLAQEALSPRLQIGASILPAIIAANKRLASSEQQTPPVYLVYLNNNHLAKQLADGLRQSDAVRQRKLEISNLSLSELLERDALQASALFVVEPMGDELEQLVEFSRQQKLLLFSPYKGDVERGVAAGFRVTDKVLPMVNMDALKQSNIFLKAFFLRIAVKHE